MSILSKIKEWLNPPKLITPIISSWGDMTVGAIEAALAELHAARDPKAIAAWEAKYPMLLHLRD